jgi:quercetin dioxygenase-like cupin family protein
MSTTFIALQPSQRLQNPEKGSYMIIDNISRFTKGWFIGSFEPSLIRTSDFEVSVKSFSRGEIEPMHKQEVATEITVIISGRVRIGSAVLKQGDIVLIPPGEYADFQSLTDSVLVCVKTPSISSDKVLFNK